MTFAGNYQGPLYAPHPDIKKMNRSEIQQNLVDCIVDGMDMILSDLIDGYSDSELMEEVKEYYPHLLEEETDFGALEATARDYGVGK